MVNTVRMQELSLPVSSCPEASATIQNSMPILLQALRECHAVEEEKLQLKTQQMQLITKMKKKIRHASQRLLSHELCNDDTVDAVVREVANEAAAGKVSVPSLLASKPVSAKPTDFGRRNVELILGLQGAHFLSTTAGDLLLTLVYDRDLKCRSPDVVADARSWDDAALALSERICVDIVGRSRGQVITVGNSINQDLHEGPRESNYVEERFWTRSSPNRILKYRQVRCFGNFPITFVIIMWFNVSLGA